MSGAPKVRAMEIISEQEGERRGPYGGAVGYFSFSGNMDTAITIRTMVIKDNIAYGNTNAAIEEIVEASKAAQFHDFVISLPHGYDTIVGERGATLSGGQRQRLSIARAVLLDPPILILDDSTSSVDAKTEEDIRLALKSVTENRTTFVIAHRLSTVHQADKILVMDKGEIVETGKHSELIQRNGMYKEIYDLQLKPANMKMSELDLNNQPVISA